MRRPGWLVALLVLMASASLLLTASAEADTSPEQRQLVSAYSPELMLREQTDKGNCNTAEEQYNPPTAADIAGLGDAYYLDLPGDPLDVDCRTGSYPKDFAKLRADGDARALTYAHIATEPGHSGFVVQYFFFYYFNQFNDLHEGDWEGMQIAFDANTPAKALNTGPYEIALYQH